LVRNGLCILDVLVGCQNFVMHFLYEVLFQDVVHIMIFFFWETHMFHWTFCFHVLLINFFFHLNNSSFSLISFGEFRQVVGMWKHYGSWVIIYLGLLNGVSSSASDLLWWYRPFIYGRLCPIYLSKELGFGGFVSMFQVSYI